MRLICCTSCGPLAYNTRPCSQVRDQLGQPDGPTDGLGAFVYAAPYPTTAYASNRFLDHAGPLVGLVIVLSFLVPLATMLRALVRDAHMSQP